MVSDAKSMRRAFFWQFVRFGFVVALGLFTIYLIVMGPKLLGWQNISTSANAPNGENLADEVKNVQKLTEYEQVMNANSPERLRTYYDKLENWPQAPVVIQINNLQKRHAVLDELVRLEPESESELFVIQGRLNTLTARERISIEHDAYDRTANQRFAEFCVDHRLSHAELAAIGMNMVSISRFLACDSIEERKRLRDAAFKQFQATLKSHPKSDDVANSFADHIGLLIKYGINPEAIPFADEFVKTFSDSTNPNVLASVKEFAKSAGFNQVVLPNIIGIPAELRERKIQQLQVQIEAMLSRIDPNNPPQGVEQLAALTRDLIRVGRKPAAENIAKKLNLIANKSGPFKTQLALLKVALELQGSTFDPTGLKNIQGKQVNFSLQHQKPKILLLVAPEKLQNCISWFRAIKTNLGEQLNDVAFRLVFLERSGKKNRNAAMELANQLSTRVLFLNLDSPEGKAFGKRILLDGVPYLILLDKHNRFLAVDPPVDAVQEIYSED